MKEVIKAAIERLNYLKENNYIQFEKETDILIQQLMPKRSKRLSRNLKKKIFTQEHSILIILLGHLYIERLVNEILNKELINYSSINSNILNTFYKKITYIKSQNILGDTLCEDLILLNKLRNKFAHNLNYDISSFDIYGFSITEENKVKEIRQGKNKTVAFRVLIKLIIMSIEYELCKQKEYLFLINEE